MNSAKPLVTIVTISKDDPSGLVATLGSTASLRADPRVQQVVVLKGSSEQATLPKDVLVLRQVSEGISAAFNEGLAAAKGEWVWFLNGGDTLLPEVDLAWLLRTLEVTKAELVAFTLRDHSTSGERLHPAEWRRWPMSSCWLSHPATLVRTASVRAAGGFDPAFRVAMDYDLWQRLFRREVRCDVVDVNLVRFAPGGLSSDRKHLATMVAEDFRIHRRHGIRWFGRWLRAGFLYFARLLLAPARLLRIRLGLLK